MTTVAPRKPVESVGAGARRRLAGFSRTLRENGFRSGLAETRDGVSILSSSAAVRPSALKPALRALFCATRSDWERFDEIFDAYWQGRGMRRVRALSGTPTESRTSLRKLAEAREQLQPTGLPDHAEHRGASVADHSAAQRHRRPGASRAESLEVTDLRHIVDPAAIARVQALTARLARAMRARLVRRDPDPKPG